MRIAADRKRRLNAGRLRAFVVAHAVRRYGSCQAANRARAVMPVWCWILGRSARPRVAGLLARMDSWCNTRPGPPVRVW